MRDQLLKRSDDAIVTEVDGEIVMLSISQGKYYALRDVAVRVWQLLEEPITETALIDRLMAEFNGDRSTILDDVRAFLASLRANDLLLTVDYPCD